MSNASVPIAGPCHDNCPPISFVMVSPAIVQEPVAQLQATRWSLRLTRHDSAPAQLNASTGCAQWQFGCTTLEKQAFHSEIVHFSGTLIQLLGDFAGATLHSRAVCHQFSGQVPPESGDCRSTSSNPNPTPNTITRNSIRGLGPKPHHSVRFLLLHRSGIERGGEHRGF